MSAPAGHRKAALYLASLGEADRRALLAQLPPTAVLVVDPLLRDLKRRGWDDCELVNRALAEEIRGLTSHSSLDVDALLHLATTLPADWTARLIAANSALDPAFMLALLDDESGARVKRFMQAAPSLPPALRDALLAEAHAAARGEN